MSYTPVMELLISRSRPSDETGIGRMISIPRSPSTDLFGSNGGTPGTSPDTVLCMKSKTSWSVCLKARLIGNVGKAVNRGCNS